MCGIVGVISKQLDCNQKIRYGLKKLEYRGYDSVGYAYILDNKIIINKCKGTVENLYEKYPNLKQFNIGIGHTRWATTGKADNKNAHPHLSFHKKIALVHNGIIDNYTKIKSFLTKNGYKFKSDTDSEVVANLIEYYYLKSNNIIESLKLSSQILIGNYAVAILNIDEPDRIYFYKRKSPLVIGISNDGLFLASDSLAFDKYCSDFIDIYDDRFGYITKDNAYVFSNKGIVDVKSYKNENKSEDNELGHYPFHMIKEIEEIPSKIEKLLDVYYKDNNYNFTNNLLECIKNSDCIIFVGCGTSYNAERILSRLTDQINKPTLTFIASEWSYYPVYFGKNPLFVFLSQSGETMDVIKCIDIVKEKGFKSLLITNSETSTLAKKADFVLPLYSGREIAVASTKAYVTMITVYLLLIGAYQNDTSIIDEIKEAITAIKDIIARKDEIYQIALKIKKKKNVFFLGRGYDYDMALEASLKLKEITYIHSEAIAGGELKHGPIALIEKGVPVFCFFSDKKTYHALLNNVNEVKSRGAKVFNIVNESLKTNDEQFIIKDLPLRVSMLSKIVFAFYLAYFVSYQKGLNVDKPRNLAKSVTVE